MANEYQIYQVAAEVISSGIPNAPIRVYAVAAEVIRSIDEVPPDSETADLNFMSFNPN